MNKMLAVSITVAATVVVYLFLLVGVPAFGDILSAYDNSTSGETANDSVNINFPIYLSPIGPELDLRPYRERYKAIPVMLFIYLVPGLVFSAIIVVILKQKKKIKENESDRG